jgi:hypothetical protein
VDSLITDKVQLFDDLVPINETTFVNNLSTRRVKQRQPNLENPFGAEYNIHSPMEVIDHEET